MPGGSAWSGWPSAASTVVGVMGEPVAHSLSPRLHNAAFRALGLDWVSVGFPVRTGAVAAALAGLRALGLAGVSVTMPHKEEAARLVDRRTEVAERLGAVNCVIRREDRLVGDNTDGEGFLAALDRACGFSPADRRCMVLGAGGAARAVIAALASAGASEVVVVNRTPERGAEAARLAGARGRAGSAEEAPGMALVVQATPAGMGGSEAAGALPLVDPSTLGRGQVAADLIYHPLVTDWLAAAERAGATIVGGLGMLVHQAALQITRWTGRQAPVEAMWDAVTAGLEAES